MPGIAIIFFKNLISVAVFRLVVEKYYGWEKLSVFGFQLKIRYKLQVSSYKLNTRKK